MEQPKANSIKDFEKLIQERPTDEETLIDFAVFLVDELILLKNRKTKEKQTLINKLENIILKLPNQQAYYFNAFIAYLKDDLDTTKKLLLRFIGEDPNINSEPYTSEDLYYLIYIFSPAFQGLWLALGEKINEYWPNYPAVNTLYGYEKLHFEKNIDEALDYFAKALAIDENYWIASIGIANIYYDERIWKSAINYYNITLKSDVPRQFKEIYFDLAWCYGKIKNYIEEEKSYRKCIEIDPNFKYALNNLGWALVKQKRYEEALAIFEESISNNNDGAYPYRNKVKALKYLMRYNEAIEFINKSIAHGKLPTSYNVELENINNLILKTNHCPHNTEYIKTVGFEEINEEIDYLSSTDQTEELRKAVKNKLNVPSEKILEDLIEEAIIRRQTVFNRDLIIFDNDVYYGRQLIIPGIGRIDLLVKDICTKDLIVVELKKDKSDDEVVGQILRYIGWVRENLIEENQQVLGIVCVHKASEKLRLAASSIPNIELFEYDLNFSKINT